MIPLSHRHVCNIVVVVITVAVVVARGPEPQCAMRTCTVKWRGLITIPSPSELFSRNVYERKEQYSNLKGYNSLLWTKLQSV